MEASRRASLKASIPEAEFWASTPYRFGVRLQEVLRARVELALYTGWFGERFAREQSLQAPQTYIEDMLGGGEQNAAVQQAMAEAELTRMALAWGLDLEDIEQGD